MDVPRRTPRVADTGQLRYDIALLQADRLANKSQGSYAANGVESLQHQRMAIQSRRDVRCLDSCRMPTEVKYDGGV